MKNNIIILNKLYIQTSLIKSTFKDRNQVLSTIHSKISFGTPESINTISFYYKTSFVNPKNAFIKLKCILYL